MSFGIPIDSSKSEALFDHLNKKDRFALDGLTGVPVNAVEYHGHGQDAHATKMPPKVS